MSRRVIGNCVLAIVGLLSLGGCAAQEEDDGPNVGGSANGATGNRAGAAGSPTIAGRSGVAGNPGFVSTAGAGGAPTAGTAGIAGKGGAAGSSGAGGSAGFSVVAGGGGTAAQGGANGGEEPGPTLGFPADPNCAKVKPASGASCDANGPLLCTFGEKHCFCAPLEGTTPVWNCVDVPVDEGTAGQGGTSSGIGFGGGFAIGGRDSGFGGITSSFGFGGNRL